ncbi:MAG: flavin reductase family protein [Bacteroidia bacterium]|nr:flavin reductase family protein [Bacteroidia bacterium]
MILNPKEIKVSEFHQQLLLAVAPRPIAFASTIDKDGNPNLSPFSFFNVFSANPPILIFSPARSGRTGKTKHTLDNIKEVPEVVVNVVNYNLVQQASLASTEYPKGVDEFIKAGLTKEKSIHIKPYRVKESPAQLECKVLEIKELGTEGGAGNLIICEIVCMHINDEVITNGKIDQNKINLVGRSGNNWYCKSFGDALFEVEKPLTTMGVGIDQIPEKIRLSNVLTGNNLGQLGNIEKLPTQQEVNSYLEHGAILDVFEDYKNNRTQLEHELHIIAKNLLEDNKILEAWKVLLASI